MAGIEMVAIHYKGGAPAILDVLGGRVPLIMNQPQMMLDPIRSGQLRALAVGDTTRSPLLSDVPTAAEAGLAGYQAAAWQALFAPARTPKDIVAKLNREINKIFAMPDVKSRVAAIGVKTPGGTPEDLRRFQEAEVKRWAKIIKDGNITID
jgi:tripartite-type tricarboxylate transporter receptor subunit TctC